MLSDEDTKEYWHQFQAATPSPTLLKERSQLQDLMRINPSGLALEIPIFLELAKCVFLRLKLFAHLQSGVYYGAKFLQPIIPRRESYLNNNAKAVLHIGAHTGQVETERARYVDHYKYAIFVEAERHNYEVLKDTMFNVAPRLRKSAMHHRGGMGTVIPFSKEYRFHSLIQEESGRGALEGGDAGGGSSSSSGELKKTLSGLAYDGRDTEFINTLPDYHLTLQAVNRRKRGLRVQNVTEYSRHFHYEPVFCAISNETGKTLDFYSSPFAGWNSLFMDGPSNVATKYYGNGTEEEVPDDEKLTVRLNKVTTRTVNDILQEHKRWFFREAKTFDVVIDVEGAELLALKGFGKDEFGVPYLDRVDVLGVEVQNYDEEATALGTKNIIMLNEDISERLSVPLTPQSADESSIPRFSEFVKILEPHGFELVSCTKTNAWFVRNPDLVRRRS